MADSRRGFLETLNWVIGGAIAAVMAVPVVKYLSFPLRKRVVDGAGDPVPVADDSAIVAGAPPVRVSIIAPTQRDAWTKATNVPLGAAWLVRDAGGQVRAFSTTCPHLGCAVDWDDGAKSFRCPCHTSSFGKDGERLGGPTKRGLDPLETKVENGRVLVTFAKFKQDSKDREKA